MKPLTFARYENDEDADYEHLEHGDDFGSPHVKTLDEAAHEKRTKTCAVPSCHGRRWNG